MFNQSFQTMATTTATTDRVKFNKVYNQYNSEIERYLRTQIKNTEDREDFMCDLWVKVDRYLDTFNCEKGQFNTWLFTVVNNSVKDYYRSAKYKDAQKSIAKSDLVNDENEESFEFADNSASSIASAPIENTELHRKIRRAIRTLRPIEKAVAILRLIKEYEYSEIALTLEIPENSVKVYIMRAKENLQKVLASEYVTN